MAAWAAPRILRWGEKNCTPTFPNVGYNYGASKHVIDIQSDQNSQFVIVIRIKWRRHVELE